MRDTQIEKYDSLVAAIAMIEAAAGVLERSQDHDARGEAIELSHIRHRLNSKRLASIKRSNDCPWHESEILNP